MYLGELTPMQESTLVQLKSRVSELLKGKVFAQYEGALLRNLTFRILSTRFPPIPSSSGS